MLDPILASAFLIICTIFVVLIFLKDMLTSDDSTTRNQGWMTIAVVAVMIAMFLYVMWKDQPIWG